MIVADNYKFIFVHIPKTGGMSVRACLEPYATRTVYKGKSIVGVTKQTNSIIHKHVKAAPLKKYIGNITWSRYFSFTFVRNPWAWLVSGYHYAKKDKNDWRNKIANRLDFKKYLYWSLEESLDKRHNTLKLGQFDFISENGKSIVNFIGHTENMYIDFAIVCKKLGLREGIKHLNKTSHSSYKQYYDIDTRRLVAKHFIKDIGVFKYTF